MATLRSLTLGAALALLAFPTVHAQVVLDDFDDGDFTNVFQFSQNGAGVGVGPTTGPDGSPALRITLNPAAAGAFAGFGFGKPAGGVVNASGQGAFTFYLRSSVAGPNLPLTLELNLQEDVNGNGVYDPATEDEFQAKLVVTLGANCWTRVSIPVASFTDDNSVNPGLDDGFDFAKVLYFVAAIASPTGPAYSIDLDGVGFDAGSPPVTREVVMNDFEGDVNASVFTFSATGSGIGIGPTMPAPGASGSTQALSVGINPVDAGAFAGFVVTRPGGGAVTVSENDYMGFYIKPTVASGNLPLTLEINLHEDPNNNGTYEGGTEDEYQANYRVVLAGSGTWQFVAIPLAAFTDDNSVFTGLDNGFDFSRLLEVVVAVGGLTGPELFIAMDDLYFGEATGLVAATLTPVGSTVIPAGGGPLRYTVRLRNTTNQTQTFRAALSATLPNGAPYSIQARNVTLPPNASVGPFSFTQNAPAFAPAGNYTLQLALTVNDVLTSYDCFPFSKAASANASAITENAVDAAYPNPFTDATTIRYALDEAADVRLAVYDVMGREVAVLVDGPVEAGTHEARFAAQSLASGLYLWRLTTGGRMQTGRLTLTR